jgi:hypothetical protein
LHYIILTKNGFGYILGELFRNSSGHPGNFKESSLKNKLRRMKVLTVKKGRFLVGRQGKARTQTGKRSFVCTYVCTLFFCVARVEKVCKLRFVQRTPN